MIESTTDKQIFTVSELNNFLKIILDENPYTQNIWISGEISNLKIYQKGGQLYFTLSDEQSQINCVLFASALSRLKFKPKNGLNVVLLGKVAFYHKRGSMSFQVAYMTNVGIGLQSLAFEQLKKKLIAEGLFDEQRKKSIPKYPKQIGLITAWDSAAMWDFITLSNTLAPSISLCVIEATMQGVTSPSSIIDALCVAENYHKLDIVLILRGGGSAEDLAGFNNEKLVRKIAEFPMPVVTAIGHEIDYTLADLASDLRTPTPTAAAQILSQHYIQLRSDIPVHLETGYKIISQRINNYLETSLNSKNQATKNIEWAFNKKLQYIEQLLHRTELANPLHKLRQGFSICRLKKTHAIVKSVSEIKKAMILQTELPDGLVLSRVESIKKENQL